MPAGRLILERHGNVAELRIDNPGKYNAMSLSMWQDLALHARQLAREDDVRVLLVRGQGDRAFVSGADIAEFDTHRSAGSGSGAYDRAVDAAQDALIACPFPVVASIRGVCMGGGLSIAMSCDLRYGSLDARFRMPAARLGLGYGFPGIHRMVGVLGTATVSELFFTARTFDGAEARRLRLVHDAFEADELDREVSEVVAAIAANAPLTVRLAKRSIRLAMGEPSEEDIRQVEAGRQHCLASADYAEGRLAFAEKRPAVFRGN